MQPALVDLRQGETETIMKEQKDRQDILVSILCATYNHEDYLRQTLDGFLSQKTDFAFEILVHEDASTDSTAAILREYEQKHPDIIRAFYQKENTYSRRLNLYDLVLFPAVRGKYIAVCEGDDFWCDPEKLQRQVDWLETHPDYSACVHNSLGRFSDGTERVLFEQEGDRDIPFSQVVKGMSFAFHTSSILARSEFILNPPDYRNVAYAHGFTDYAIGLRLCLSGKVRFLDRNMSVYRIGSNPSAWSSGVSENYEKLTRFVRGEIAMLRCLLPRLSEEQKAQTEQVILEREYELLRLEGKVEEMVKEPYRAIHRQSGFKNRAATAVKRAFPRLHEKYRKRRGYGV